VIALWLAFRFSLHHGIQLPCPTISLMRYSASPILSATSMDMRSIFLCFANNLRMALSSRSSATCTLLRTAGTLPRRFPALRFVLMVMLPIVAGGAAICGPALALLESFRG
jgi:hypothetical protein